MPRNSTTGPLLFITETPVDTLWEQLSSFESLHVSSKSLERDAADRSIPLGPSDLERKATALSYCIRNAREYMCLPYASMTTATTSNYYGCLWLIAAASVASGGLEVDLDAIEQSAKEGHGLGNYSSAFHDFPDNEYVYVKERGLFAAFLSWSQYSDVQIREMAWKGNRRPEKLSAITPNLQNDLIPIIELLARVPELIDTFETVTGRDARCFELFHAANGLSLDGIKGEQRIRFVGIVGDYSREHLADSNLPFEELREFQPTIEYYGNSRWAGLVPDYHDADFFASVYRNQSRSSYYVSPLTGYYFVSPLSVHIKSMLAIHMMLAYQLSILARYRPAVWRQVLEGSLDQYRVLFSAYNRVFARVVPQIILNSLMGRRTRFTRPGGFV